MRQYVLLLIIIIFTYNCNTVKKNISVKPSSQEKKVITTSNLIIIIPDIPLIDNFEGALSLWRIKLSGEATGNLSIIETNNNKIGHLTYKVGYSDEEYSPHSVTMIYTRKMDFTKYSGIKFSAYGTPTVVFKLKMFEIEDYYGKEKKEIWYKSFKVTQKWKVYRIPFNQMEVEEFFEQDYVSDNIQSLSNIIGIAFSVQNNFISEPVEGELYIDNIELY